MSLSNHTFILKNDGTLWGCGENIYGQLGLGDTNDRNIFTKITDNVKSVYTGYEHTIILKNDSTLWGCGLNGGQLGLGDTSDRYTFTQITANTDNVKSVYCGGNYTFILKNDSTLWGCGNNGYGQLGLGDTTARTIFTKIINDVKSVDCGRGHTIILKNDGTLWGCGRNSYGQLGLGDMTNRHTFIQITTNTDNIKSFYCGDNYELILKNDGTLWGCGRNANGQLGLGDKSDRTTFVQITTNTNDIKSICCGECHTLILKNNGTLWGTGYNDGKLGLGDTTDKTAFIIIGINTNDIKSVYCGYGYTLILKNDGTLWGCGDNDKSQLGLGNTPSDLIFTQITTNTDNIKCFANEDLSITNTIKIYDLEIGCTETLDTNNFRNIPVDKFEKIKVLRTNPVDTYLNCLISFDKKQTWKTFDGLNWNVISDISPQNIISNGMELIKVSQLNKSKLIAGGFAGDLDFKIAMKTNDKTVTSSVTKIYIEYK